MDAGPHPCAAGAVAFTRYNPLLRLVMKWIGQRSGRSIDTSRDHESPVRAEVESFAREFARSVAEQRRGPSPATAEGTG